MGKPISSNEFLLITVSVVAACCHAVAAASRFSMPSLISSQLKHPRKLIQHLSTVTDDDDAAAANANTKSTLFDRSCLHGQNYHNFVFYAAVQIKELRLGAWGKLHVIPIKCFLLIILPNPTRDVLRL
jgi:hypothetical protein